MWSSFVLNWRRWSSVVNAAAGAPTGARARALLASAAAQRASARDPPLRRPRGIAGVRATNVTTASNWYSSELGAASRLLNSAARSVCDYSRAWSSLLLRLGCARSSALPRNASKRVAGGLGPVKKNPPMTEDYFGGGNVLARNGAGKPPQTHEPCTSVLIDPLTT